MKQLKVVIIIVNWNSEQETLKCLASVQVLKARDVEHFPIVIDNASDLESIKKIEKHFPQVPLIRLKTNTGFTGANNHGIEQALRMGADYVWLLNNDTVIDRSSGQALQACFDDPSVGIAGSKIYFMKGQEYHRERYQQSELGKVLWYAGGEIDWSNVYGSHRGVDEVDHGQYNKEEETDFVTGCSMMISRECLSAVGRLDERYFAFLEDMDYCVRARHIGYKVVYCPKSLVWHKNAGSTGGAGNRIHQYYMTRNRLLFGWRYAKLRTKLALVKETIRLYRGGNHEIQQGILDAYVGRWGKRKI